MASLQLGQAQLLVRSGDIGRPPAWPRTLTARLVLRLRPRMIVAAHFISIQIQRLAFSVMDLRYKPPRDRLLLHLPQNRIFRKQLQPAPDCCNAFGSVPARELADRKVLIKRLFVGRNGYGFL